MLIAIVVVLILLVAAYLLGTVKGKAELNAAVAEVRKDAASDVQYFRDRLRVWSTRAHDAEDKLKASLIKSGGEVLADLQKEANKVESAVEGEVKAVEAKL